ncbi:MAG TPA: aminotransferase class I/II-fold pyridoxal phosphate-dependent enzyme [Solirubrobacteraceae bacterium]|nr:aminotransferase class I/II-fold pyridoxal phosphate-dependent enzyme [Solirubrobacteraceae bacterium]
MGLLDHYKQFEEMSDEEVSAQLREEADERRRKALAVVDPLDLSRTTWPDYPPSAVVNAITFAARRGLHRYMEEAHELRAELALRRDVTPERIVLGDGASQLLASAAHALMEPGDELITPWPSYPLYPVMARQARGAAVPVHGFGVDAVLEALNERTRIVALCNPNDPTGELLGVAEIRRLLDALPERVVVLLDEALREFVDAEGTDDALALCEEHPRLLVFRSFSKAWGLAGLRCGYAVGGPGAEDLLTEIGPPLGIGELAQAGVLEAVRHGARAIERRMRRVAAERARLLEALRGLPVDVTPSQANILWIAPARIDGAELANRMARAGVIVRAGGPLGDPRHIRASIHDAAAGDRFLRALTGALGQG